MSFGGKISRYLATKYERVAKMVLMGTKLGLGVIVKICNEIQAFCEHPPPIIPAQIEGTLDPKSQSQEDREFLGGFNIPVIMAWGETVLRWPSVEPADFLCPAL